MKHQFRAALGWAALISSLTLLGGVTDRTLDFYWVDSQGGGSTLIVTPGDESILIDTGNPGGRDAGRIHKVATQVAGLKQIDHLIVTHLHVDHFGGAAELVSLMPVRRLYDNGIPDRDPDGGNDAAWPLKIKAYREMEVGERVLVMPGSVQPLKGAADPGLPVPRFTFVAARKQLALDSLGAQTVTECHDPQPKPPDPSDNANSVVTLIQFGPFRYFNGGDLTWNIEATLVCPVLQVGSVDVYQVNHHGLDVSNNPRLLQALAPSVAVFNNGPRKGCMPEVVNNLRTLPSLQAVYQVHRNLGNLDVNAPREQCANDGEAGGNYLKLSVAPDGRSYVVTVPSTGHRRTFATRL
ncbi:MAG TPA: MBL fold metallo-hydrolase [Verrucomicrobiota bacterium]|nr:MBL fold metallo-hydrolase [Verrucomicrobiota bacterium]